MLRFHSPLIELDMQFSHIRLSDQNNEEFDKHKEFLLAPAIRRADGKLYMEPRLGIIKDVIFFRQLSDITTPDDIDAAALMLPSLITPPA